jgi:hypothetical protein
MDRRLNQACRPSATPLSRSLLNCHRNDARTVENGLVSRSGVSKSAKVVLVFDTKFSCKSVDLIQSVLHLAYRYAVFPLRGFGQNLEGSH